MAARFAVRVCLAAAASLVATAVVAQDAPSRREPQTFASARDRNSDITAVSVLTLAKDQAEGEPSELRRRQLRFVVASYIKTAGQQAAFGTYVADAIDAAAEAIEYVREKRKSEADARRALLAGDEKKAIEVLAACEQCSMLFHFGILDFQLLTWELEAGDLASARRRIETTYVRDGAYWLGAGVAVARAYVAAGRRAEGAEIILGMRTIAKSDPASLAQALWRIGADEEARDVFGQAVARAFMSAELDVRQPLPAELARVQFMIGDRDGAVETVLAMQRFAAPVDDVHPIADLPPFGPRPKFAPGSERWMKTRSKMPYLLARANLDSDAYALLNEPLACQPQFLADIVRGQAERGDFAAALETIALIRTTMLTVPGPRFDPQCETSPNAAVGIVDEKTRRRALDQAELAMKENGARLGNDKVFRRFAAAEPFINSGFRGQHYILRSLVAGGLTKTAVEFALQPPELEQRIVALGATALALAGVVMPFSATDPLIRNR